MMTSMQPSIYDALNHDSTAARDCLSAMMEKERTTYQRRDYLRPPNRDVAITESDRTKLVDWCYSIVDRCDFDREIVATAMELADRFLSRPSDVARGALRDRVQFQLVVVASLCIAIKVDKRGVDGGWLLAALGQGIYSTCEVEAMELEVLEGLSWRICPPTSVRVAHGILSLTLPHVELQDSTWALVLDEVRFQCEYAVRDYCFALQRPSTVALAAIFNALDQLGQQDREAMFRALVFVIYEDFHSPKDLMAVTDRLKRLLLNNDVVIEDYSIVSESVTAPRSSEGSYRSFSGVGLESYGFGDQNEPHASPRTALPTQSL